LHSFNRNIMKRHAPYPGTYQHDMTNTVQKAGKPAKALDAIELLTEAHQEIREAFKEYGRLITSGGEVR